MTRTRGLTEPSGYRIVRARSISVIVRCATANGGRRGGRSAVFEVLVVAVLVVAVRVVGVAGRATVVAVSALVACTVVVRAPWLPPPHAATDSASAALTQIHREEIAIVRGQVTVGWAVHARE